MNRIETALRVVFVGVRILNLGLKSAQKNDTRKRVCLICTIAGKKRRNRRFSRRYTIWDMSQVK